MIVRIRRGDQEHWRQTAILVSMKHFHTLHLYWKQTTRVVMLNHRSISNFINIISVSRCWLQEYTVGSSVQLLQRKAEYGEGTNRIISKLGSKPGSKPGAIVYNLWSVTEWQGVRVCMHVACVRCACGVCAWLLGASGYRWNSSVNSLLHSCSVETCMNFYVNPRIPSHQLYLHHCYKFTN